MLEKNNDYIETLVSSTDCAFTQNALTQISVDGHVYTPYIDLPTPGEFYIIISKEKFEKMQADDQYYRELAKQWEENYNLLLKKIGFDTVEELVNYLDSEAECDTLHEALASLEYNVKFARDERRDLSKKLEECETDYISERDKEEALKIENEQLKKELHGFDPTPEFKELLKKLYSTEDVEKLEWVLKHTCGGMCSANDWRAVSSFWQQKYKALSKLVGFSSVEEIQDYLTNEAEADTLYEAISKLHDQVKYTCDEWYSANSRNNSWKAAAECNSPRELIEKLNLLRDDISGRSTVIESYKRDIEKWQTVTGYLRPEDISTESMISKSMANEIKAANERLWSENAKREKRIDALLSEIREWKNATGCTSPRQAIIRIRGLENAVRLTDTTMLNELESNIDEWQNATGRIGPEEAKQYIDRLKDRLNKIHDCSVDW